MNCPYCDYQDSRGAVHRHLADAHGEKVVIRVDDERGKRFYGVVCSICGAPYEHQVKPRNIDPDFLREFDREIKLVAFDMLLYHLQGEHSDKPQDKIPTTKN